MALRAVPDHPKFQHLMALSGLPKYEVLGLLEALWHFTGRFTPQGNIGKYPDAQIAAWIGWTGQALDLISLLITCGWIEEDDTHRLIVHDWNEHADRATRATLARHKCSFVLHTCNTHDTLPVPVPVPEPVIISKRNTSSHPKPPKSAVGECADDSVSNSKKETNALQARFDLFWAAYPRRTAKGEAVKSWFKIKPSDELAGRILDSVEAHKTCEQWLKSNGQFIPHPATWLNQRHGRMNRRPSALPAAKTGEVTTPPS